MTQRILWRDVCVVRPRISLAEKANAMQEAPRMVPAQSAPPSPYCRIVQSKTPLCTSESVGGAVEYYLIR